MGVAHSYCYKLLVQYLTILHGMGVIARALELCDILAWCFN